MIAKLQMPLKQKLGVGAMFALGFFVVIASSMLSCSYPRISTQLTKAFSYPSLLLEQERDYAHLYRLNGRNCSSHHCNLLTRCVPFTPPSISPKV